MAVFASHRAYWQFATTVTRTLRYSRDESQASFLAAVLETSKNRVERLQAGAHLWRARVGNGWRPQNVGDGLTEEFPSPLEPDEMKPRTDRAPEGRANPKGIPYLYLATHRDTAIAEVRPWMGSHVSIGEFVLTKDIRVVNAVTDDHRLVFYLSEPEPAEREQAVWRDIDRAFSRPVTQMEDSADYAPTQVLAEFFKENGLDGIAYGSALGAGHNVVLFDLGAARLRACGLAQIKRITFESSMDPDVYEVKPKD
jgi:RES domain-containing protein